MKILLVDNDESVVTLFEEACKALQLPCDVQAVRDKEQAMAELTEGVDLPSLIVMDLDGRKPDEFNFIITVRKHRATRMIPVVVLGTHCDAARVDKSYECGASAFIHKPIDNLVDVIGDIDRFWLRRAELPGPVQFRTIVPFPIGGGRHARSRS